MLVKKEVGMSVQRLWACKCQQSLILIFLWRSWSCEVKYWLCLFQVVDQKKLQKAEAKIKAKQDKRAQEDQTPNEIRGRCDDGIYKFLR